MKNLILVILILCGAATGLDAQPSASRATAGQVLEKYAAALGGETAAARIRSLHMKGTVEVANIGVFGSIEIFAKAPSMRLERTVLPSFGALGNGFDGRNGWRQTPLAGVLDLSGDALEMMKRDSEILREFQMAKWFAAWTFEGTVKSSGRECHVLAAVSAERQVGRWHFDAVSGLLVRTEGFTDEGLPLETEFDDYREVGGVKYPFTLRQFTPVYRMITRFEAIRQNIPLDDSVFTRPKPGGK